MQQRQVLGKSRFCNFSICEPLEIILAVKFNCRRGGGEAAVGLHLPGAVRPAAPAQGAVCVRPGRPGGGVGWGGVGW